MKKVIAVLLACLMIFSSVFVTTAFAERGDVDIDVSDAIQVFKITDLEGRYKTQGRTPVVNGALMMNWSASAIEFNAMCQGNVVAGFQVSGISANNFPEGLFFSVFVDGEEMPRSTCQLLNNGVVNVVIAQNLVYGAHNFKIVRQTEACRGTVGLVSIALAGEFTAKPVDKKLSLEFVGDSITTAIGNLTTAGAENGGAPLNQDATKGYAYLTANALNADYSIVAVQGIGASVGYQPKTMLHDVYPYVASFNGNNTAYNFAKQPDVVVIGLGTNDINTYSGSSTVNTREKVQQGFEDMLALAREKNPNAKIVWIYNMMTPAANDLITAAVENAGGAQKGFYSLQLTQNNQGGNSHPSVAGQQKFAEELTAFLASEVLEVRLGDADGDEVVSLKDAYEIARYQAGYDSGLLLLNADLNHDKSIDLKDVILTTQKVLEK